jgi:hypothetical protein
VDNDIKVFIGLASTTWGLMAICALLMWLL